MWICSCFHVNVFLFSWESCYRSEFCCGSDSSCLLLDRGTNYHWLLSHTLQNWLLLYTYYRTDCCHPHITKRTAVPDTRTAVLAAITHALQNWLLYHTHYSTECCHTQQLTLQLYVTLQSVTAIDSTIINNIKQMLTDHSICFNTGRNWVFIEPGTTIRKFELIWTFSYSCYKIL